MRPTLHDRLSFLLAASLVAASVLALGLRVQVMADHSIDFGGSELNVLHGIQRVVRGEAIYMDPEQPPFAVVQYTPAYHVITGRLCRALGIAADDARGLQQISRAFALLLNLLTMLAVALAARAAGAGQWSSLSAAALTSLAFSPHFYSRVDALYALFFVFAVLFMLRWATRREGRSGTPELILAGLCTALALLSKQTAVLLIGLMPLSLLAMRAWRAALLFVIAFSAGIILTGLLLLHGERMDLFLTNVVDGLRNGISTGYLEHLLRSPQLWGLAGWLLIALSLALRWLRESSPPRRLLALWLAPVLVFGIAAALKSGSDYNYFFELLLIAFIASAAWLRRESARALKLLLLVQCLLFAGTRLLALREWRVSFGDEARLQREWDAEHRIGQSLRASLSAHEYIVLTYRSPLEIELADQVLVAQRDIIQWSQSPPFDLSRFDAMMRDGQVRYVISDRPIEVMHFIQWDYALELDRTMEGRWLYSPVVR
ncbi:MAG: DUF2029 domain-containing protein [Flavobacteriales bacterium]|nr:DUF2029 domain-containing protein [Flavobacteriales bacterium]